MNQRCAVVRELLDLCAKLLQRGGMGDERVAENRDPFATVFLAAGRYPLQLFRAVLILEINARDFRWRQNDLKALQFGVVLVVAKRYLEELPRLQKPLLRNELADTAHVR